MTPMMIQISATSQYPPPWLPETGITVPATPMPMPIEPSARTTEDALMRAGAAASGGWWAQPEVTGGPVPAATQTAGPVAAWLSSR